MYVPPQNTSRECSKYGHTDAENRLSQESFRCQKCVLQINAVKNAAINILTRGRRGCVHGDAGFAWVDEVETILNTKESPL
ncbi:MAG: transposase [Oligoflexia bacterium]|nr:transposase [Oligoflexia bacterium]